jgi:Dipeptidyl peptidase IV (DPP IV) N-terminal region
MEARMKPHRVVVMFLAAVLTLIACTSQNGKGSPTKSPSADAPVEGSIVFNHSAAGKDLAVFTINLDGTEEQRIRPVGDGAILSPDGTRLMDPRPADDGRLTTTVFDIDGSGYEVLPIDDPTLQFGYGAWSTDGNRFVTDGWDETRDDRKGLYTRRSSDGGDIVRLTDAGIRYDFPMTPRGYSPDGSRILFFRPSTRSEDDGAPMDLFAVGVDRAGLQKLDPPGTTTGLVGGGIAASWSPDGRRVAVVLSSGSFWDDDARAVFIVDVDGTKAKRITPHGNILCAQWSPDGRWIAFDNADGGPHDLFVVHPDGTGLAQITSTGEDGLFSFGPVWSPDSTKLLFVRGLDELDSTDLWTVNVDGTGLSQVTASPGAYGGYAWVPSR